MVFIKGYENKYSITKDGKVYSHRSKKYLATDPNSNGYLRVWLYKNNKGDRRFIHKLIADEYLENIHNHSEVNHIDGNKLNNTVENLEWCSRSYNLKHAYKLGLRKKPTGVKG